MLNLDLDHICFAVKSDDEVEREFKVKAEFELFESQGIYVSFIRGNNFCCEFIKPFSNPSVEKFVNSRKTPAFHHLGFKVPFLFDFMKNQMLNYLYPVPQPGYGGKMVQFAMHESVLLEFCENLREKVEGLRVLVSETYVSGIDVWVYPCWQDPPKEANLVVPVKDWKWSKEQVTDYFIKLGSKVVIYDS